MTDNINSRVAGHLPTQHVFGHDVRIPMEVIPMGPHEPVPETVKSGLETEEPAFMRANNFRQAAKRAICDADDWRKVRRAIAGRQRPRMHDFNVGDQVCYWRDDGQPGSTSRWHGPGMIIGRIENTQKIYICVGSRVYRCAPEYARFANGEEQQVISTLLPELDQLG